MAKLVSTHSRPKAADDNEEMTADYGNVSTHSRPKAAETKPNNGNAKQKFQHTAARRRLVNKVGIPSKPCVSTHSRPKAAGQ